MSPSNTFRLELDIKPNNEKINRRHNILFIGSCFAQEIGNIMSEHCFNVLLNPHGILFNPHSMANALNDCIDKKEYTEADLTYHNNFWHSFNHHGKFSNENKSKCLDAINTAIINAHNALNKLDWLIISFGSAHVYVFNETKKIAANCHKSPQQLFQKNLLTIHDIIPQWNELLNKLKAINPSIKTIFTVSPVRHIRDGIIENNLSKSILLQSVHAIVTQNKDCFYFPAYELILDDLRDYRFYKDDYAHPNALAINYIWEKFGGAYFDEETKQFTTDITALNKLTHHNIIHENHSARKLHELRINEMRNQLKEKYKENSTMLNS